MGGGSANELDDAIQHALKGNQDDNLSMELELHFACKNLKNMDIGSETDSAIAVYRKAKYFSSKSIKFKVEYINLLGKPK